jgi:2-keto-4-pentenoate hydratase
MMNDTDIKTAANILWQHWNQGTRFDELPAACRPTNRAEAYAIQAAWGRLSGQSISGWKIAATSIAGQKHIGVDGPLAGRLLANRVLANGATISLADNAMRVAEAEFVFRFAHSLPPRETPYDVDEVLAAVDSLHPGIEVPDSRYQDFIRVGAPQLIADDACARWFVLGEATTANWREHDLVAHRVTAYKNGQYIGDGTGLNVLGDPRVALTWLVNELRQYGGGIQAGEFVTTGTCIVPLAIEAGDVLRFDFGEFGLIEALLN